MKLFAILFAAILALCTAVYQPTETPPVEVDIPIETPQQEQNSTPTIVEEMTHDAAAASPQPQEIDMALATDTVPASAGTAEVIVEAEPAEEGIEPPMEVASAIISTTPTVEEPIIVESARTDIPTVVEHAKTGGSDDAPVIIEHAKTGYEGEDTLPTEPPVIEPVQSAEPADISTAIAAAEAFAIEAYSVTIDPSLDFNNSAYRFPAAAPLDASQEFLNNKAIDIVNYTFQQQIRQYGVTIEKMKETGIRCRIYVEQAENDLLVYCFYA